ncbi:hypothetical protein C2L65_21595 [Paraburkholderia terrae]|uniref:Uncharacterized protein n=1 Tax=Paraburkholderia terrae TaxID=311230 RepID=A0A2I8ETW0_9BURK|nr:hypothetical protein C2L65_21595 [Paraburkholderia terrae]
MKSYQVYAQAAQMDSKSTGLVLIRKRCVEPEVDTEQTNWRGCADLAKSCTADLEAILFSQRSV